MSGRDPESLRLMCMHTQSDYVLTLFMTSPNNEPLVNSQVASYIGVNLEICFRRTISMTLGKFDFHGVYSYSFLVNVYYQPYFCVYTLKDCRKSKET